MKTKISQLTTLVMLLLWAAPARGDLTITATPGFVFSDTASGRPTVANLNRALNFTYSITGTIGGTNAGLAAKSVSGTMLMDSVVDNSTVEFDGSSPRAIRVKDAGITSAKLDAAIAGLGLGGGAGSPLSNKVDGITLSITNDVLTLGTNIPLSYMNVTDTNAWAFYTNLQGLVTFTTTSAVSGKSAGASINTAHSLGFRPSSVWGTITCTTSDLNYAIGDELPVSALTFASGASFGENRGPAVFVGANSTNVFLVQSVASTLLYMTDKSSGGLPAAITPGRWTYKIYARP